MLRRLKKQQGSVLVEFALVAPLLVLVLLGIMVMGVVINSKIVVAGAAREAGRTWSITGEDAQARAKALDAITSGGLKLTSGGTRLFDPNGDVTFTRQGEYVVATVTYRQPTFVPLMAQLLGSGSNSGGILTLRSQAVFRTEKWR